MLKNNRYRQPIYGHYQCSQCSEYVQLPVLALAAAPQQQQQVGLHIELLHIYISVWHIAAILFS